MLTGFWTAVLAGSLVIYLLILLGIGVWAARQAGDSAEEYLLAGRNLPMPLAVITLLATWFGAGVMLTVTDEVASQGLPAATLDPLGVALCLFLAGWWLAAPLWNMGLLTIGDFYRQRFGVVAEKLAAVILIPSYFGWIAVQFIAVARLLELFFGLDLSWGIVAVMLAGTLYTLLGGLRAVVWTDVFQLGLVLIGVVYLAAAVAGEVGWAQTRLTMQAAVLEPRAWSEVVLMLDLLVVGALGNLPAQDLIQRFLCVRSAPAARRACFWAGGGYLVFGLFPIGMGLLAVHVLPETSSGVVMGIANQLLTGPAMVIFVLAVVSAVLSTIDGAILSPAGVLAQNLLPAGVRERWGTVAVNRAAVVFVALCALASAFSGKAAYSLLEEAYSLMLVGLLVPLLGGLWFPRRPPSAAIASMLVGTGLWVPHLWLEEPEWLGEPQLPQIGLHLPLNLTITAIAAVTFFAVGRNRPVAPSSADSGAAPSSAG